MAIFVEHAEISTDVGDRTRVRISFVLTDDEDLDALRDLLRAAGAGGALPHRAQDERCVYCGTKRRHDDRHCSQCGAVL